MAILCLAADLDDLTRRIGNIVVGYTRDQNPVTARQLGADGAMTVLLKDAMMPNLVQTLENNPALVHGGPFANIAHGCNSVLATRTALKLGEYVITEAGFGADLGAEKFFNIKCRKAGLSPSVAVVVATIRALKMHGGVAKEHLGRPDVEAVGKGLENLARHLASIRLFGVPTVVAINHFSTDADQEWQVVRDFCGSVGVAVARCTHWSKGSAGIEELARKVVELAENGRAAFRPLYSDELPLWDKVRCIAQQIYGADDISADPSVKARFTQLQESYGHFPVCMAKTQYSLTTDPNLKGAPTGHTVPIRELRLSAGAEFIVAITGDVMTMPGLPKAPSANSIRLDEKGEVQGLF
jgi:formate--tetrahydrofolate ligase